MSTIGAASTVIEATPENAARARRAVGRWGCVERDYVAAVLRANDGNRARTLQQLGIGAATLYRKIKEYRLPAARE